MAPKRPKPHVQHRTGSKVHHDARWKATHAPIPRGKRKAAREPDWSRERRHELHDRDEWYRILREQPKYAQNRAWVDTYLPSVKSDNPAYLDRLARSIIKQLSGGLEPKRQAARGHATTREHPRQFYVTRVGGVSRRVGTGGTGPAPGNQKQQREYRDPAAMLRWVANRLPAGTLHQIVSHGELQPTYLSVEGPAGGDVEMPGDDLYARMVGWRSVFLGERVISVRDLFGLEARIFLPGTVDLRILRW